MRDVRAFSGSRRPRIRSASGDITVDDLPVGCTPGPRLQVIDDLAALGEPGKPAPQNGGTRPPKQESVSFAPERGLIPGHVSGEERDGPVHEVAVGIHLSGRRSCQTPRRCGVVRRSGRHRRRMSGRRERCPGGKCRASVPSLGRCYIHHLLGPADVSSIGLHLRERYKVARHETGLAIAAIAHYVTLAQRLPETCEHPMDVPA